MLSLENGMVGIERKPFEFDESVPIVERAKLKVPNAHKYPDVHVYWARRGDDEVEKSMMGFTHPTEEECKLLGVQPNLPGSKVGRGSDMVLMISSMQRFKNIKQVPVDKMNTLAKGIKSRVQTEVAKVAPRGEIDGEITFKGES